MLTINRINLLRKLMANGEYEGLLISKSTFDDDAQAYRIENYGVDALVSVLVALAPHGYIADVITRL